MKNSSSERKTKTQDCQKLKFYQIQINSNINQCSYTVLMLKVTKWVGLQLYPILCCIWKVISGDNTVMHQPKPTTTAMLSQGLGRRECRLVPLPAAIPSSDETGRYAWISRSAGFCRTGSGWPAGRTLQWARPQPTEPHVVRHTYNLRRHETVDLILNSRYLGHGRLMITLPTELWSNNLENKLGYNRDFLHYIII